MTIAASPEKYTSIRASVFPVGGFAAPLGSLSRRPHNRAGFGMRMRRSGRAGVDHQDPPSTRRFFFAGRRHRSSPPECNASQALRLAGPVMVDSPFHVPDSVPRSPPPQPYTVEPVMCQRVPCAVPPPMGTAKGEPVNHIRRVGAPTPSQPAVPAA